MKKLKELATIILTSMVMTGCAESTEAITQPRPVDDAVQETSDADTEVNAENTEPEVEYPINNDDGSYTYQFDFLEDYLSTDFAGTDVLDSTADYPRERFEDVFMYSKGDYLNDPSIPEDFFDEWGYACAAADCKIDGDPEFGFNCQYIKQPDGNVSFIISDINYCLAVQWEKGQIIYHLWDNELARIKCERLNEEYQNTATKEILARNDLMGTDAKAFVDSFDEGLYDKVLSTLPGSKNAYSPLFRFDNGVMRAKNVDEDGIGFEFLLPNLGRKVFEVIVDKPTGRIYGTIYRTPYPGEDFYAYPAGVEWDENGPVVNDPYSDIPEFEPSRPDESNTNEEQGSDESTAKPSEEQPAAEKTTENTAPVSTGAVIDEEEFQHGVLLSAKKGTIVNDDFATGVKNSLSAQLDGMGASESSDPGSLIYRSKPFRFGTSAEEAANAMINDVMPMLGFDLNGKNYYIASTEKFDNGYVVTVGWTRWN